MNTIKIFNSILKQKFLKWWNKHHKIDILFVNILNTINNINGLREYRSKFI
jgi:hypothetical protein